MGSTREGTVRAILASAGSGERKEEAAVDGILAVTRPDQGYQREVQERARGYAKDVRAHHG